MRTTIMVMVDEIAISEGDRIIGIFWAVSGG